MKNVYLIAKPEKHTVIRSLTTVEAEEQIPKELGIRLSSLFLYDRLVLVEGPTDEEILREWALKLEVNLGRANVGFLPIGGSRNFGYFASDSIVSFLTRRQVEVFAVMDRDERDDAEVTRLQEGLGTNFKVHVLPRREIENYLLAPRALSAFIGMRLTETGGEAESPDAAAVEAAIDEEADALRDLAIEKRVAYQLCRPLYWPLLDDTTAGTPAERIGAGAAALAAELTRIAEGAAEVEANVTEAVDSEWKNKTHVVPGEELLVAVCGRFGVKYRKKAADGQRVARLMRREEIAPEIGRLLTEAAR
jgi:hypothetical protein